MDANTRRPDTRQHYWDATRAALMLLGIPYHAALAFQAGGWIVATRNRLPALDYVAEAVHLFRMPAFFVVAGFFAAMCLSRQNPVTWFRGRLTRLGLPLVAALLTLIPILNIACELSNFAPAEAFGSFWALSLSSGGYWVRHLWFIIVLLYFCGAAALACRIWPGLATWRLPERIDAGIARRPVMALLALAVVIGLFEAVTIEAFYIAHLNTTLPQEILRIDDLLGALPWLLAGFVLHRSPRMLEAMSTRKVAIMVLAAAAMAGSLMLFHVAWAPIYRFVGAFSSVLATQVVIAVARFAFDRPSPVTDRLVRASFPIYLFHVPAVAWLAMAADWFDMPPALGFVAVTVGTFAVSLGLAMIVERVPVLRTLYGGVAPKPVPAPSRPPSRSPRPIGNYSLQASR